MRVSALGFAGVSLTMFTLAAAASCTSSSGSAPTSGVDAALAVADGSAGPSEAGPGDGGVDAAPGEAGSGADGSASGGCQLVGTPVVAMGVTPAGGTTLYHVHPAGPHDAQWLHLTQGGGKDFQAADFAVHNGALYVTNGAAWWRSVMSTLPSSGDFDLGAPVTTFGSNTPPTVEFIGTSDPFIARGGGTFYEVNVGAGTWRTLGPLPSPGSACSERRDFVAASTALAKLLGACGAANNYIEVTFGTNDAGAPLNLATVAAGPGAPSAVYAVPDPGVELGLTKIFSNGALVRSYAVCSDNGKLIHPIGGLRSAAKL